MMPAAADGSQSRERYAKSSNQAAHNKASLQPPSPARLPVSILPNHPAGGQIWAKSHGTDRTRTVRLGSVWHANIGCGRNALSKGLIVSIAAEGSRFRADLARSVRLLRAFRTEQEDTARYYTLLADDTVGQLGQYTSLRGSLVLDVGGGPGFFVNALRAAGARAFCVDADAGELAGRGTTEPGSVLGSALDLPVRSAQVDVSFSSNVLEHVPDPHRMLAEMIRVTRPGGVVFCAFTNWLSPWGGHETSPWHYLGGERAAQRYQRRYGKPPKNRYGNGLYPVSVVQALRWARSSRDAQLLDAVPRYLPGWSRPLLRVPGAREVLTWNLLVVLKRR